MENFALKGALNLTITDDFAEKINFFYRYSLCKKIVILLL